MLSTDPKNLDEAAELLNQAALRHGHEIEGFLVKKARNAFQKNSWIFVIGFFMLATAVGGMFVKGRDHHGR